jgi:hypothetical protein
VNHFTEPGFWDYYSALPESVQRLADKNFELLKRDSYHPSLRFKKVGVDWSVRVGSNYRALGKHRPEGIVWFWIGAHSEYDRILS